MSSSAETLSIQANSARQRSISVAHVSPHKPSEAKLEKSLKDFEAFLITQLLTEMRKTIPQGGLFGNSQQNALLEGMMDEQMGQHLAEAGGLGLKDVLRRQLDPTHHQASQAYGEQQR